MQSFITTKFLCGVFLLIVTIASAGRIGYDSTCSKCHRHSKPKVVQIIPAVRQTQGPHWDHETKKLYYVQTMDQKICRYDPVTGKTTYADIATGSVGTAVPVKNEPNKFLVSAGQKFAVVTWDPRTNNTDPEIKMLASAENVNGTHLNDGKADTHGRFWAGTMGPTDANNAPMILADQGAFYRVTGDGVVKPVIKPVTISNGISWNKEDKTMYYVDTGTQKVAAYDFDAERGEIFNRRIVFDLSGEYNKSGHADSITIDKCGCLYCCMYDGSRVIKIDPYGGRVLQSIEMPTSQITSVAWGGDQFDILYVTTSRNGMTPEEIAADPRAGGVFAVYGLRAQGFKSNVFVLT